MSAIDPQRTFQFRPLMSAFRGKAGIDVKGPYFRFRPKAAVQFIVLKPAVLQRAPLRRYNSDRRE
jgi:hypothetical protein